MSNLTDNIKRLRETYKYSQQQLADKLSLMIDPKLDLEEKNGPVKKPVSQVSIHQWEKGLRKIPLNILYLYVDLFKLDSLDQLFWDYNNPVGYLLYPYDINKYKQRIKELKDKLINHKKLTREELWDIKFNLPFDYDFYKKQQDYLNNLKDDDIIYSIKNVPKIVTIKSAPEGKCYCRTLFERDIYLMINGKYNKFNRDECFSFEQNRVILLYKENGLKENKKIMKACYKSQKDDLDHVNFIFTYDEKIYNKYNNTYYPIKIDIKYPAMEL